MQGDTLATYMFLICLVSAFQNSIKRIDCTKKRKKNSRSRKQYDRLDYEDDLRVLINTPARLESQLHSPEQASGFIGLYVNANKTEFMFLNKELSPLIAGL